MSKELLSGTNGYLRTDMYCHDCDKNFVAKLDLLTDGNHIVECPHCGHEHCRTIKKGKVTGDRWDGRNGKRIDVDKRSVWKSTSQPIVTSSASAFIRDRWLNKEN